MRYRGHLDALRNGIAEGWAVDLHAADSPVIVELLVDGLAVAETTAARERPDLRDAHIGTGRHGYMLALPASTFDGRSHSISVRIKGSKQLLIGTLDKVVLDQRPVFEGALTGIEQGAILRGFLRHHAAIQAPVTIDLILNGGIVAQTVTLPAPAQGDSPAGSAFAFDLAALWQTDLLSGQLECRIAGTEVGFPAHDVLNRVIVAEPLRLLDGLLRGTVQLPRFVPADTQIAISLNSAPLDGLNWEAGVGEHGAALRHFSARLTPEQAAGVPMLEIRLPKFDYIVGGSARRLWPLAPRNLLANALFQSWDGSRPTDWALPDGPAKRVLPEYCRLDMSDAQVPLFGPLALRLEIAGGPDDSKLALLAQALPTSQLAPGESLEFVMVARADRLTDAEVVLDLVGSEGLVRVNAALKLRPRWTRHALSLPLPAGDQPWQSATLSIEVANADGNFNFAAMGLGLRGFDLAPEEIPAPMSGLAPGTPAHPNLVLNADLDQWSRGLSFGFPSRRFETADNWFIYSRQPPSSAVASVERVLTRDPACAAPGREAFGLGLQGDASGMTRVEALLDTLNLRSQVPEKLRFYACRKSRPQNRTAGETPQQIERILLLLRSRLPGERGAVKDEILCTIAQRVELSPGGRYHQFKLPHFNMDWPALTADYRLATGESTQIVLAFEFEGALDCVLADVYLGIQTATATEARKPGYIGLEDPNIANQLDLVKGLTAWARPEPIRYAAPEPGTALAPVSTGVTPSWRLPYPRFPSVELIIPVFNAPDELMNCLHSIERNTRVPHLLTLVDDASDPATAIRLDDYARGRPWVKLIRNPVNLGYTRSSNLGMAQSAAQWVLLLNSDTIVSPYWLEGLIDCALSDPKIKFVGALSNAASWQSVPELFDSRGKFKVNALPDGWSVDDYAALVARHSVRAFPRVALLNGFCTLMERQALENLGFLDEVAFPVGYGEENDLCLRAGKAGYELAIADHVYVYHVKSASFGGQRRDALSKQGMEQLLLKHPDVDLKLAQQQLMQLAALVELRRVLLDQASHQPPRSATAESPPLH